ncbi:large terminase [Tsuneonella deserti]|uniref:Large terminase n=1 Tax=Tsuneonella deserti TaxID=2035528 RepID=A0ABQ1SBM7_9SPHN|nr:terminase family protein [Tsuneonella deserti]GGE01976.1 large terminase [Tsuneonella deserti]
MGRTKREPSRGAWLRRPGPQADAEREELARQLAPHELAALGSYYWEGWARDAQLPPREAWRTWLICAGRGFGKTRAGAEWVRDVARNDGNARIALVGASLNEVRNVMVEGDSGVLAAAPGALAPVFEPSLRKLTWENGAIAWLYSAGEPESLRGPQHSHAWCDEIAKWDNANERAMAAWNNLQLTMRLGDVPRVLATTTPRLAPLMHRLMLEAKRGKVVVARGRTTDNSDVLPADYLASMIEQFAGSGFGRQELDGELVEDVEGALWTRALLERCREVMPRCQRLRTVVAVDPPAGERGDACGIVVAALLEDGNAVVLADASIEKASPERWARAVAGAARDWGADRVVAEANQGGAMVKAVLHAADHALPVTLVHASKGKAARAEPVAALYESGRVRHAGMFAILEDQMCGLMAAGRYEGPGRSPDRADALVWALSELMLGRKAGPRVRGL